MRAAAVAGVFAGWELMVRSFPGHDWQQDDQLVQARTGLPLAPFNGVWALTEHPDTDRVLAAVDTLTGGALPWNVQLRTPASPALQQELEARRLRHTADIPLMAVTPGQLAGPNVDVTFRAAETYDELGAHLLLLEEVFGMPVEVTRRRFPLRLLMAPGVGIWIGRVADDVVTTGLHAQVDGTVGIYNVATPEQHRGQGYGGAVTAHAARAGFAGGAGLAWLQASPMGAPVYRGLGFETVESWQQWMPEQYIG